jgi:hypothetical protein
VQSPRYFPQKCAVARIGAHRRRATAHLAIGGEMVTSSSKDR